LKNLHVGSAKIFQSPLYAGERLIEHSFFLTEGNPDVLFHAEGIAGADEDACLAAEFFH
jgi:hypothetical protein